MDMGGYMKKALVITVIIAAAMSLQAFALDGVKWQSIKEGMERAKAENKPILVDFFYGKGCPRCEMLQKEVYENPSIAEKIMKNFIPVKIDLTKKLNKEEENLGNRYDFKNDCLLLFLDSSGNVIEQPGGKRLCFVDNVEPGWVVKYLDMVIESHGKAK